MEKNKSFAILVFIRDALLHFPPIRSIGCGEPAA
jgi:hypothetical protein